VLGYKNTKSVSNRISILKKKYGLPFGPGGSKGAAAAGASGSKDAEAATSPKVPATPSKNRVSKQRATSAKKVTTPNVAKGKGKGKGKAVEEKVEDVEDAEGVQGDDELSEANNDAANGNTDEADETIEVQD
jgi:hypothetical protein